MPPKSAKKTPPGPGSKRGARANRGAPKSAPPPPQNDPTSPEVADEDVVAKVEEVKDEILNSSETEPLIETKLEQDSDSKKEDIVNESVDEYERDEQLDFEDNEAEYEPEEYGGGVDYDEKEIEPDDDEEEGIQEEEEEEVDGDVGEEIDEINEEIEEINDEIEGEEEDEEENNARMDLVDDAEEQQEHHDVFQERRKRKEFEVFVGGLDKDATEDDLRKVFSEAGEVTEIRLMMNPLTKKNKGFAFLRFATVEQAKRACAEFKSPLVNGKKCGVTPSQDSDTLFLGNICKTWTKEALENKLKHYGVENVEDVTLVEDGNNKGSNRGFAFLEFSSHSDAMAAFKLLQRRDVIFGVGKPAKVSFAESFIDPGDEIMAQVKTVFVDNLPASWDEDRVKELLKKFGHVEKIELARNMPSAKRKDFGFVTFDTHDAAVACARGINNRELGEGEAKTKVRARLSRPLQKGRGKHSIRDYRPALAPRGAVRSMRAPPPLIRRRPIPRSLPMRGGSRSYHRQPPPPLVNRGFKRHPVSSFRDRRPPPMPVRGRARPLPPLPPRSYDRRRPPAPMYPKGLVRSDYSRRDEPPPRRDPPEYPSRLIPERRPSLSYREDYPSRGRDPPGYSDLPPRPLPRPSSRPSARRPYVDEVYEPRYERERPPPPSYREGRRESDSVSGSKRSYGAIDEVPPPRYADDGVRHSRARLDYDLGGSRLEYGDDYTDRLGRSSSGYASGRTSLPSADSHGLYDSRHDMSYARSSLSGSNAGEMYSSSYGGDYVSRGSDVGSGSYSSLYPGRGLGGSGYPGSGGSGSYY